MSYFFQIQAELLGDFWPTLMLVRGTHTRWLLGLRNSRSLCKIYVSSCAGDHPPVTQLLSPMVRTLRLAKRHVCGWKLASKSTVDCMEKEVGYEGESDPYGLLRQSLHSPRKKRIGTWNTFVKISGASTQMGRSVKQTNYENLVVAFFFFFFPCALKFSILTLNSFTKVSFVSLTF